MDKIFAAPPLTVGVVPHNLTAQSVWCGTDLIVVIGGGTRPHIGATAQAVPRPSLQQDGTVSASVSVLCCLGHKDDLPAREIALQLASCLNTTVTVTVGIHLDAASPQDLAIVQKNFRELQEQLLQKLAKPSMGA